MNKNHIVNPVQFFSNTLPIFAGMWDNYRKIGPINYFYGDRKEAVDALTDVYMAVSDRVGAWG
jgi:hypothetical protein